MCVRLNPAPVGVANNPRERPFMHPVVVEVLAGHEPKQVVHILSVLHNGDVLEARAQGAQPVLEVPEVGDNLHMQLVIGIGEDALHGGLDALRKLVGMEWRAQET